MSISEQMNGMNGHDDQTAAIKRMIAEEKKELMAWVDEKIATEKADLMRKAVSVMEDKAPMHAFMASHVAMDVVLDRSPLLSCLNCICCGCLLNKPVKRRIAKAPKVAWKDGELSPTPSSPASPTYQPYAC
jgi:hypothetical protein